uniref:Estradiol 17-beta-dehydrogenase 12 n=1 Tax=Mesocestoides corti TaxID=53468 RepID=A0A5K3FA38_MESCO
MIFCIFAAIVLTSIGYVLFTLLGPILTYFVLLFCFSRRGDLKKAGDWAVVTGATDGIGKAFCQLLAKDGLNIFLISRNRTKLQTVAESLEKQYNVRTKIFVADCTKDDFYDELQRELTGLSSISCLINNVGMYYKYPDDFCNSDFLTLDFCQDMITVNVTTLTKITRLALPKMVSDPLPTHSVHRYVINIGSLAGLLVNQYAAVYSATKAYVCSFTQALAVELRDTCVRAQIFTPSYVASNMSHLKTASLIAPSALTFADSALSMVGVKTVSCGYFYHDFKYQLLRLMPTCLFTSIVTKIMFRVREKWLRETKEKVN